MWFRRDKTGMAEASAALEESKQILKRIETRGTEVTEVAQSFKEWREKNHIAEQLEEIIFRRRSSFR